MSPLTIFDASPPEQVSAAAEAGPNCVGLRGWSAPDEPAYPMLGDAPLVHETLARLRDTGLKVWDVELIRLRPDAGSDGALRILDAGAYLGPGRCRLSGTTRSTSASSTGSPPCVWRPPGAGSDDGVGEGDPRSIGSNEGHPHP